MTPRLATVLLAALLASSCTRQVVTSPAARRVHPPTAVAAAIQRQTINAVDAGEGDLRVRELRRRMAADPGDLAARMELARHYEELGSPELAAEHYRLAAARFPDEARVRIALARLARRQGLAREAAAGLAQFLEAHRDGKDVYEVWSWLGILRDELGELASAEQAHREAVRLRPDLDALHNNLGYNLLLQGKGGEAAAEFRRALAIRPGSEIARNNLGLALASQPAEALSQWRSASDPATAHSNLAALLIERGRYAEARRELEIALGYRRDHAAALHNLRLVSELDGEPATLQARAAGPRWKRIVRSLGRAVVGAETRQKSEARHSASR
jgi:Tfp pilus assembly protein PilF